jgi:protein arginine kinase
MAKVVDSFRPYVTWANSSGKWPDIIFSTRVRLARNLSGYAFPQCARPGALRWIMDAALEAARATHLFGRGHYLKTAALSAQEKNFLIERHHISHNLASSERAGAVVVNNDESLSVMVNEEDHLRLQSVASGFSIPAAFEGVNKLDDELGRQLTYAFSGQFGFLTACPTNAGTGMRVSCLVHLPALSRAGQMPKLLEGLSRLGVTARGIYGEGTCVLGDFYQISNATCLGHTEAEFCANLDRTVSNLIRLEISSREKLATTPLKLKTEDSVFRAYGLLKNARAVSYGEFMQNISLVRMGVAMGYPIQTDFSTLNQLTLLMQPAHLEAIAGRALEPAERDAARAGYIRKNLN